MFLAIPAEPKTMIAIADAQGKKLCSMNDIAPLTWTT